MLEVSWNEKSLNSFYKKMDNLVKHLKEHTTKGVEKASEETRKYALSKKKGNKDDDLILKEINSHSKEIISRVYTHFSWAPFLEYGTGRYAEAPHIGKSKTFIESGFRFWYAPATVVNKSYTLNDFMIVDGVFYPMITQIRGKTYVMCFEQKSRPFMRPTAFYMRGKNVETIKKEIKKGIISDIK